MEKRLWLALAFLLLFSGQALADFQENYPADGDPVAAAQLRENLNQLWVVTRQLTKDQFGPTINGMTVAYTGGKVCSGNTVYTMQDGSIDFSTYSTGSVLYVSVVVSGGAASLSIDTVLYNPAGIPLWTVSVSSSSVVISSDDRTWVKKPVNGTDYVTASLQTDRGINTSGTYYDGPSLCLSPGTWLLTGNVTIKNIDPAAIHTYEAKLWDGTNAAASGQTSNVANGLGQISLSAIVTVSATATWKISCASGVTNDGVIKAAMTSLGAGNNASMLTAVKLY